jgi:hypothetical protein
MDFLDRLFGRNRRQSPPPAPPAAPRRAQTTDPTDEQAIARYRYMVRTAPPETVEQAHAEAFAKLTPEQRAQVLRELGSVVPERERAAAEAAGYDPRSMARVATRAEMRQPGVMERTLGGGMGGMGMGGMMAGTIFGSLVAGFVGSVIAHQFIDMLTPDQLSMVDQGVDPGVEAETYADSAAGYDETGQEPDPGYDAASEDFGSESDLASDDFGGDVGEF